MKLGDTGYVAAVGPYVYQDENDNDWDYYSIEVEKPGPSGSAVLFEREFSVDEIPGELWKKGVHDIVTFDPDTRVVTFDLGRSKHSYTLPAQ